VLHEAGWAPPSIAPSGCATEPLKTARAALTGRAFDSASAASAAAIPACISVLAWR